MWVGMRVPSLAASAGVTKSEQLELFSISAAILHLGHTVIRGWHWHGDSCVVEVGEDLMPPQTVPRPAARPASVSRTVPLQPGSKALGLFCTLQGVEVSQVVCWLCHPKLVLRCWFLGCPGQAHTQTGLQLDGEEGQPCPGVTEESPHHLCTLDIYR